MEIARFECPACGQPIEIDKAHARRGMNCPSCHKFFTPPLSPDSEPKEINSEKWAQHELKLRRLHIRRGAKVLSVMAIVFVALAVIAFMGAFIFKESDHPMYLAPSFWLAGLAFWFHLVAQIIHIRANTEK